MRAALSLGANLADRAAAVTRAVEMLRSEPGFHVVAVSPLYETEPVGGPEQPDYVNAVVVVESREDAPPLEVARRLLEAGRAIENALGRTREVRWGPRSIDVDVLAVGDLVTDDPELTVPHPRLRERAFVLVPWADVDPGFVVAGTQTVADLVGQLSVGQRSTVRRLG